jgi:hypothetical protein
VLQLRINKEAATCIGDISAARDTKWQNFIFKYGTSPEAKSTVRKTLFIAYELPEKIE